MENRPEFPGLLWINEFYFTRSRAARTGGWNAWGSVQIAMNQLAPRPSPCKTCRESETLYARDVDANQSGGAGQSRALRTKSADSWGQVLGQPAQSDPAETTNTGAGAAAPLVQEIDDPGYLPPDRADVLPEPDNGEPEDDETDAAAEEPASWQTESVVGRPADLDVTPAPGPETPANANKQARPKRSSRKTSPNTEVASKRAADREAKESQRPRPRESRRLSAHLDQTGEDRQERARQHPRLGRHRRRSHRAQELAGKGWAKRARELGYHPRAASRLQLLGRDVGGLDRTQWVRFAGKAARRPQGA